jgi:hypothetical protein
VDRDEIKNRIRAFLYLFEEDLSENTEEERLISLGLALDELAVASHFVTYTFDNRDYPLAPERSYDEMRKNVIARFAGLGPYNLAGSTTESIGSEDCIVGDSIDDMADIANELYAVEWYWHHTSVDDALWHFEDGYAHHWGDHLRCLQLYLYRLRDGL